MKARRAGPAAFVFALAVPATVTAAPSADATPSFARDVAPLIYRHCTPCHHAGGSAPFPLVTYADAKGRARQLVAAVTRREMPPWKPEPGFGSFVGERRLSDVQVDTFRRWLAAGAPSGAATDAPPPPTFADGWTLGPPDLVVQLPRPYRLQPGGADRLRQFVIPVPTSSARFVKAWQFRTSAGAAVHHATLMLDSTRATRRLDDADPEPGYEGLVPPTAHNPDGYFLGWTPGQTPYVAPDRLTWRLDAGDDIVAMLHLMPGDREQAVDVSVGLYFADRPPVERPVMVRLTRQDLDIPPGEADYLAVDRYTLPVDVDVYGVQPHAHNLAREVRASATLPDGTVAWLVKISDWDFHWQDAYRFAAPLALPAGTVVTMEIRYDNTDANRRNPFRPARRVTYGQHTSEEMGDVWIQVVPRRVEDRVRLEASLEAKLLPQNISGYEVMLRRDPDNVTLHDDVALLYVQAGDLARAAAHFGESVRLQPASAAAHYNLGNVLLGLGKLGEAEARFREALRLSPDYRLAREGMEKVRTALAAPAGRARGK